MCLKDRIVLQQIQHCVTVLFVINYSNDELMMYFQLDQACSAHCFSFLFFFPINFHIFAHVW